MNWFDQQEALRSIRGEMPALLSGAEATTPAAPARVIHAQWAEAKPPSRSSRLLARAWDWAPFLLLLVILPTAFEYWLSKGPNPFLTSFFLPALVVPLFVAWSTTRTPRATQELLRLIDHPEVLKQFPVRIAFSENGICYGNDNGLVSFTDGLLMYTGFETAFGLSSARVTIPDLRKGEQPKSYSLRTFVEDGPVRTVSIAPFRARREDAYEHQRLHKAIVKWDKHTLVVPECHIVLPPDTPKPGWIRSAQIWARFGLCVSGIVAVADLRLMASAGNEYTVLLCLLLAVIASVNYLMTRRARLLRSMLKASSRYRLFSPVKFS